MVPPKIHFRSDRTISRTRRNGTCFTLVFDFGGFLRDIAVLADPVLVDVRLLEPEKLPARFRSLLMETLSKL